MNPKKSVTSPEDELDTQLVQGFDEMLFMMMRFTKNQLLKELVDDTQVTPPQFGLLWCLSGCDAKTMSEISDHMNLTHGASTGLVERLLKLGLVNRVRSEADRRVVCIAITSDGQALVNRVHQKRHAILRKMLKCLSLEERQLMLKVDTIMKDMLSEYAQ